MLASFVATLSHMWLRGRTGLKIPRTLQFSVSLTALPLRDDQICRRMWPHACFKIQDNLCPLQSGPTQPKAGGYSPSWEKLNLVPEGEVTLEPEEKGELAAVSCRPPAEWDRNHSLASSCVRSWELGVYLETETRLE